MRKEDYFKCGELIKHRTINHQLNNDMVAFIEKVITNGGYIAGGFARRIFQASMGVAENVTDIDIFCRDHFSWERIFIELSCYESKVVLSNSTTLKMDCLIGDTTYQIDIVKPREEELYRTYGTLREILSTFDFSITRIGVLELMNSEVAFLMSEYLMHDLATETLRFENIICPIMALKRIIKYCGKGYKLPIVEKMKIFATWELMPRERRDMFLNLINSWEGLTADEQSDFMAEFYVD